MLALIGAENTVMKNLNREKEKNGQIKEMINMRMLILIYTIRVIPNKLWLLIRTISLMSSICFSRNKKIMYTIIKPTLFRKKWALQGCPLKGHDSWTAQSA